MEAIDILIARVAERLTELNLSERAASLEATGSPDAIRYIRARRAMPSASRLASIARSLKATPEWLIGESEINAYAAPELLSADDLTSILDMAQRAAGESQMNKVRARMSSTTRTLARSDSPDERAEAQASLAQMTDVPIFATSRLPDGQFGLPEYFRFPEGNEWHMPDFDEKKIKVQQMTVDPTRLIGHFHAVPIDPLQAQLAYGIYLPINALDPAFPAGSPALVSTWRMPQAMDIALFHLSQDGGPDGDASIITIPARIHRIYSDSYDVKQFSGGEFNIPASQVSHIHRIFTMEDLLS